MPFAIKNRATGKFLHVTRGSSKQRAWRDSIDTATTWPQAHHAKIAAVCAVESEDIDDDVIFDVVQVKIMVYPTRGMSFRVQVTRRHGMKPALDGVAIGVV